MEHLNLMGLYEDPQYNCLISLMRNTHGWYQDGRLNQKQYSDFIHSLYRKAKRIQQQSPLQIKQAEQ